MQQAHGDKSQKKKPLGSTRTVISSCRLFRRDTSSTPMTALAVDARTESKRPQRLHLEAKEKGEAEQRLLEVSSTFVNI